MAPVMNAEIKAEIAELEQEKGIDKRLVDNINDLKEKIMIVDNHLDDRVIEIIKTMYLDQIKKEMEDDTLFPEKGNWKDSIDKRVLPSS